MSQTALNDGSKIDARFPITVGASEPQYGLGFQRVVGGGRDGAGADVTRHASEYVLYMFSWQQGDVTGWQEDARHPRSGWIRGVTDALWPMVPVPALRMVVRDHLDGFSETLRSVWPR
jgi:hypothetical protein